MHLLKRHIIPKIDKILEREFPIMAKLKPLIQAHINRELVVPEKYADFNLGGAVTMVAVKFGASELPHCDWLDAWSLLSIVLVLSRKGFEGADLALPQLDGKLPIPRRAFGLARTRALCHWSTPLEGDRLVLTFFVPALLVRSALINAKVADLA
uniref:Prolyl 4-hydroxylase alpha subunit Fe(2+) 2OG dioxygenase domain-containing protein n=1 Tax=Mycena chlorophos TaxID=658473 RepID=A0ABQ0KWG1_MYCCL|nr:predicted protein [Mycena chlorophos]